MACQELRDEMAHARHTRPLLKVICYWSISEGGLTGVQPAVSMKDRGSVRNRHMHIEHLD